MHVERQLTIEKMMHYMKRAQENSLLSKRILVLYSCLVVVLYIVGGNSLTINLADRLPVKIAEIVALPLVIIGCFEHELRVGNFGRTVICWLFIGAGSSLLGMALFDYSLLQLIYGLSYGVRIVYTLAVACIVCRVLHQSNIDILSLILKCYLLVCAIGMYQLIVYPIGYDWYAIFYKIGIYFPVPDPHIGRLVSTYFDPNYLASCLCIPISISIFRWRCEGHNKLLLYAIVFILVLILTNSRSGFLGLAIILVIFCCSEVQKKTFLRNLFILAIGIIATVLLVASDARIISRIMSMSVDPSASARFSSWAFALDVFSSNPIIGIGYNMLGAFRMNMLGVPIQSSTGYGVDSSLLLILLSSGLLGFTYFLAAIAKDFVKIKQSNSKPDFLLFISITVTSLIICNFNNLLLYPLWMFPFFLVRYHFHYRAEEKEVMSTASSIKDTAI